MPALTSQRNVPTISDGGSLEQHKNWHLLRSLEAAPPYQI
jgi:hypothetical protein